MKIGFRKPSIKRSIKARTTGKLKRQVKKAINPIAQFGDISKQTQVRRIQPQGCVVRAHNDQGFMC